MSWKTRLFVAAFFLICFGYVYPAAAVSENGTNAFPSSLPIILIGVYVFLFGLNFTSLARRTQRGPAILQEGLLLERQGRLLAAVERFEAARPFLKNSPGVFYYLGSANLGLWKLSAAEEQLRVAAKPSPQWNFNGLVEPKLALVHALQGRSGVAETILAGCGPAPEAVLAEAILCCRVQRWEEAEKFLARSELRTLGGTLRGLVEAVQAFVAHALRGESRPIDRVGLFGEAGPENLRAAWPELVSFLDERDGRALG